MRLNEIFYSLQGEGRLTGVPSVFVRFSGCNEQCFFCDTKYHPEGEEWHLADVMKEIKRHPTKHVVLTGGEPTIQLDHLSLLCEALHGYHITVETNGTNMASLPKNVSLLSVSPKKDIETFDSFIALNDGIPFQIKLLYPRSDLNEWQKYKENVLLMPITDGMRELDERANRAADAALEHGFTYCDRLHLRLWRGTRGK
jgi:7-carboxy-7-deazaguanine synthase